MALGWHTANFQGAGKAAEMLHTSVFLPKVAGRVGFACFQSTCVCLGLFVCQQLIGWRRQLFGQHLPGVRSVLAGLSLPAPSAVGLH